MSNSKTIQAGKYSIEIPNWDKVLFPKKRLCKSDLIQYYDRISDYMLPFLKNHVVTLHRFPDGVNKEGFYQKQYQAHYPSFLKKQTVKLVEGKQQQQVICNKKVDILYLAGQGTIAFHIWLSKISTFNKPNKILFDLDPPHGSNNFAALVKASFAIKKVLDKFQLPAFVMTTGSHGLHIAVPIKANHEFDEIRFFAKKIAEYITNENPSDFTIALQKAKRQGRLFIDYTRNAYGQTSIVPYSLRAIEVAPVATPLGWDELSSIDSSQAYTIDNIFKRLAQINNPWQSFQEQSTLKKEAINEINQLVKLAKK